MDIATIVLSILGIIVPIIFLITANNTAKSQLLLQIRQQINDTSDRLVRTELELECAKNTPNERFYREACLSYREQHLNIYDNACLCCLNGKLDKRLFAQMYCNDIRDIVEKWLLGEEIEQYCHICELYKDIRAVDKIK